MGLRKGQTNNPSGRPKNAKNKLTTDIRAAYEALVSKKFDKLEQWLDEAAKESPAKAIELFLKLSEFVLPKLQSMSLTSQIEKLPDEQIDTIIKEILNSNQKSKAHEKINNN